MGENKKSPVVYPDKKYDKEQKTIQYCSIEIYQVSESYDSKDVIKKIKEYCESHDGRYAIMLHDIDYYNENTFDSNYKLIGIKGDKKSNHYHCLISFKNRVYLNDIALKIGIEDRWIKILKHDYDFDNMIVYVTHIKYDPTVKAHYLPVLFDSNIKEYCMYLYDCVVEDIESQDNNICNYVDNYLNNLNEKCKYSQLMFAILQSGYGINEYNKHYRIIKDLLIEHNLLFDSKAIEDKTSDKIQMLQRQIIDLQNNLDSIVDENMKLRGIG